jgi:hypothetical protein
VKLFEFRDWTESVKAGFPQTTLEGSAAESMLCSSTAFRWVGIPQLKLNPDDPDRESYRSDLTSETKLFHADGQPHAKHPTVLALVNALLPFVAEKLSNEPAAQAVLLAPIPYPPNLRPEGPTGEPIQSPIVACPIVDPTFFSINGTLCQLESVHVKGSRQWQYSRVSAEYKILVVLQQIPDAIHQAILVHLIDCDLLKVPLGRFPWTRLHRAQQSRAWTNVELHPAPTRFQWTPNAPTASMAQDPVDFGYVDFDEVKHVIAYVALDR